MLLIIQKQFTRAVSLLALLQCMLVPAQVFALTSENGQGQAGSVQTAVVCPSGEAYPAGADTSNPANCTTIKRAIDCASGKVSDADPTQCAPLGNDCNGKSLDQCQSDNPLTNNINKIVDYLSAGVGIVIIGMIILGGIQYSLAGDNPNATTAAKKRITDALIALLVFIFIFGLLQWLIPGGL